MKRRNSDTQNEEETLPVGYRFSPTDEELIVNYLKKQPSRHALSMAVHEVDIYQYTPWTLQRLYPTTRSKGSYFITPRNKKYEKGYRPARQAGKGYWKATCKDQPIYNDSGKPLGAVRKSLVYFKHGDLVPEKTNWMMKEFRIGNPGDLKNKTMDTGSQRLDGDVLCMIYELNRKSYGSKGVANNLTGGEEITDDCEEEEDVKEESESVLLGDAASKSIVVYGVGQLAGNENPSFDDSVYCDDTVLDHLLSLDYEMPELQTCFAETESPYEIIHEAMPYIARADSSEVLVASTEKDSPHCEEDRFPIGVRFEPTDEEIILYYLMKQPCSNPLALIVQNFDFYEYDPWTLQEMYPTVRVKERYFMTQRNKKERLRRDCNAGTGYWKAKGRDKPILNKYGESAGGIRRTLVYYQIGGQKTKWTIHEYRLGKPAAKKKSDQPSDNTKIQVFCKMYENRPKNKVYEGPAELETNESCNNEDIHMTEPVFAPAKGIPLSLPEATDVLQESCILVDQNSSSEFPPGTFQNYDLIDDQSYLKTDVMEADLSKLQNGLMDQAQLGYSADPLLMSYNACGNDTHGIPSATSYPDHVFGLTQTDMMTLGPPPINFLNDYFPINEGEAEATFSPLGGIETILQLPGSNGMPGASVEPDCWNQLTNPYSADTDDLTQFQNLFMYLNEKSPNSGDQPRVPYSAGRADIHGIPPITSSLDHVLNPAETKIPLLPQSSMKYCRNDCVQRNEEGKIQDPALKLQWSIMSGKNKQSLSLAWKRIIMHR